MTDPEILNGGGNEMYICPSPVVIYRNCKYNEVCSFYTGKGDIVEKNF